MPKRKSFSGAADADAGGCDDEVDDDDDEVASVNRFFEGWPPSFDFDVDEDETAGADDCLRLPRGKAVG